mgnify:CR=1 FL=1|tara:strand:- start:292 stop:474 length:183 start_codon:yes stop_codon:yes gene_type:complete
MSEDISRKIVDSIEAGKLEQAKNEIFDGIKGKAGEAVDMKRVEKSVNWMTDNTSEGEVSK